jgi:Trm5-related predicted tRNA methylase
MSALRRAERRLPCPAVDRARPIKGQCPSLGRLSEPLSTFGDRRLRKKSLNLPKRVVKMAIIVMRVLNPHEVLYQGEAAILYGLSPTTVSSRQSSGELCVRVNVGK